MDESNYGSRIDFEQETIMGEDEIIEKAHITRRMHCVHNYDYYTTPACGFGTMEMMDMERYLA